MMNEWRGTGQARRAEKEPNDKLREIAGRLKSLPYRDMRTLADAILAGCTTTGNVVTADAILAAADALETA